MKTKVKKDKKYVEKKKKEGLEGVSKFLIEKKPKFRLVSYTMGATIPVGMYANIQPSVTVEAETMEIAERAAMAHIEALFAKYRVSQDPTKPVVTSPLAPKAPDTNIQKVPYVPAQPAQTPVTPGPTAQKAPEVPLSPTSANGVPTIVLSEPFKRAKGAIESCTSHEALKLVSDQIEKSVKLIDTEKVQLKELVIIKYNDITIAKTA